MAHFLFRFLTRFFITGLLVTSLFRLFYSIRYSDHLVRQEDWGNLILQGLRVDVASLCMLIAVPVLIWVVIAGIHPRKQAHFLLKTLLRAWPALALTLLVLFELPTISFIEDYNVRPNYLMFEYLSYPQEVIGMLWGDYRGSLLISLIIPPLAFWGFWYLFKPFENSQNFSQESSRTRSAVQSIILLLIITPMLTLGIRSSIQHRPLNPSLVAFSDDPLVNQLVLNSAYAASYSQYMRTRYDSSYKPLFQMEDSKMRTLVESKIEPEDFPNSVTPNKNIVVLLQESLGAEFVGSLGGAKLTPNMDRLAEEGIWFEHLYATGTRSARGVEAVMSGFLPTESESVLKRPKAQQNFFTFACTAQKAGYETIFVYGGEAHFDNMKSFLLNNCFEHAIDRAQFNHPHFTGSWGVSDEDLYEKVDGLLMEHGKVSKPKFIFAFTVSNHSPWEYPEGRISPAPGEAPHSRETTVRYADQALGNYFDTAQKRPYWQNSLFLVIADHNSRVYGADQFPVNYFHIPGLILGGTVSPKHISKLCSQIDMLPTLLNLAGIQNTGPAPGRNVLSDTFQPRAVMQYYDTFAYLEGDILSLINPAGQLEHYRMRESHLVPLQTLPTDLEHLADRAIAYHLWPEQKYREGSYSFEAREPTHPSNSSRQDG